MLTIASLLGRALTVVMPLQTPAADVVPEQERLARLAELLPEGVTLVESPWHTLGDTLGARIQGEDLPDLTVRLPAEGDSYLLGNVLVIDLLGCGERVSKAREEALYFALDAVKPLLEGVRRKSRALERAGFVATHLQLAMGDPRAHPPFVLATFQLDATRGRTTHEVSLSGRVELPEHVRSDLPERPDGRPRQGGADHVIGPFEAQRSLRRTAAGANRILDRLTFQGLGKLRLREMGSPPYLYTLSADFEGAGLPDLPMWAYVSLEGESGVRVSSASGNVPPIPVEDFVALVNWALGGLDEGRRVAALAFEEGAGKQTLGHVLSFQGPGALWETEEATLHALLLDSDGAVRETSRRTLSGGKHRDGGLMARLSWEGAERVEVSTRLPIMCGVGDMRPEPSLTIGDRAIPFVAGEAFESPGR